MFELQIIIVAVSLAYYWTGFEMVEFHTLSSSIDRPAYLKRPWYLRTMSALIWPYVATINSEFGWHFCCFIGYTVVVSFVYGLSAEYVPSFVAILVLGVLRLVPLASVVINAPSALIASLVFLPFSKIFGWRMPNAIKRMKM